MPDSPSKKYEPRGKASHEINDLYAYISNEIGGVVACPRKQILQKLLESSKNELQPKPEISVVESQSTEKATKPKKRHIGGYFDEAVYRQLKIVGAEEGLTTQDILAEALNAFFRMYDKPPIA